MLFAPLVMLAQQVVVSGTVVDDKTGEKLRQVSVSSGRISVVTNEDGDFTLKLNQMPPVVSISHLGYKTQRLSLKDKNTEGLRIRLVPTVFQLREIVVRNRDPRELVDIAIDKIPENYSKVPELLKGFYRETAMKRRHYIYVAEGVVDMYKTAYDHNNYRDRVAIRKGRRLLSSKQGDTLTVKVMGGPVQPIQLDVVKNHDFLLNAQELNNYNFEMLPSTTIADRLQYVVAISPRWPVEWPLYNGRLYIDRETLAFTKIDLSLDMSNRDKVTEMILRKKPFSLRFTPHELTVTADYVTDDGVTRLNYIRNVIRFRCDWKRKLFKSNFNIVSEMVVTDRQEGPDIRPIKVRDSFFRHDNFYDKVIYFEDPDFWGSENIIEPTEDLMKGIDKIKKRLK